jgi:FkbM family methyltransferase
MSRVETAARVFRRHGASGVMAAFKDRYLDNWIGRAVEWCYGRALELRGNTVEIEGCTFSLDSPAITTASKSKFMFDRYERPEREAIRRFVDPGLPVVEFGGSIGVVSCLANRRLTDPARHVVVEANAALVPLLLRNRDRNRCRFSVLARMVGYGKARAPFYADRANFVVGSGTRAEGRSEVDTVEVETIDLRSIVEQYRFERCTLVCDIEGGEADLVRYEADVLRNTVETLILEVHEWVIGKARVGVMLTELEALGFEKVFADGDTYAFRKAGVRKR